jgi:murein DD-endopeptidase MepM/ murein hydrolase activator NlpD
MNRITIMIIPPGARTTTQLRLPHWSARVFVVGSLMGAMIFGYLILDYIELRRIRSSYQVLVAENEGLKGEARALMGSLDDVKSSLKRVKDFSGKLTEITQVKIKDLGKTTGIGPLSVEEYKIATSQAIAKDPDIHLPLGINPDKLFFRPVFERLYGINLQSTKQAIELQNILANLTKQQNLLSSIPTISPVNGWITSGYGYRSSPFTGEKTLHKGVDVASPVGTPVYAPADGVVIFTGDKSGFGNFIMIAHGYGVVSRYGHNAQNLVQSGQKVRRGDQIATVGESGRTTGPHLHYEVLVNGLYTDPKKFILNIADESFAH